MQSLLPYMAGLIFFVCSPHNRLAASDEEMAHLKLRVQQLEAETHDMAVRIDQARQQSGAATIEPEIKCFG